LTAEPELGVLTGLLRSVVERALAKDPDDRPTAPELLDMLVAHSRPGTVGGRTGPRTRAQLHIRRRNVRRWTAAAAGALALTVGVPLGALLTRPWRTVQLPNAAASVSQQASVQATDHPSPSTSVPSRSPTSGAPTNIRMTGKGDSVVLTWAAPATGNAAVVVAGGRTGQQMRAFQQLPAGTTTYAVYGLDETKNYCFSVAAADSPNSLDTPEELCTHRP